MLALSVRTRLTLFYSAVLSVMLAGFGLLFYHALGLFMERSITKELEDQVAFLQSHTRVENGKVQVEFNPDNREEAYLVHVATRFYEVFELPSGRLVIQSEELEFLGVRPMPDAVRALAAKPGLSDLQFPTERLRFDSSIVPAADGSASLLVRVGIPLDPADAARREFLHALLLLMPIGIALAGLAGWQMARRALRPMMNLAIAARKIDVQQLHERLPVRGIGDEVDDVAKAFNETLGRLENSVEQMKQFTASISHELRTPLTALRGEAEVALLEARSVEEYKRVLASQLEEFDKLTHMINQLLVLARAEAGEIRWADQAVDLSAQILSLTEQMEPVAAAKKIGLKSHVQAGVFVYGDANWIERAILNLLDNAIKFTGDGGKVDVTLSTQNGQAVLRVEDTGVGIPATALPRVFDRFFRAEPSRSKSVEGVGLGLALAKWIVEKHRGHIEARSEIGKGSSFTIRIPLANRQSPIHS
ncbi:MAG: heavy metal sensor histidine kinase [Candidatus Acidiferrales bacterium]